LEAAGVVSHERDDTDYATYITVITNFTDKKFNAAFSKYVINTKGIGFIMFPVDQ
jgi:hypothetical protein